MTIKPLAYINVEERKLEWAEPITWHTPTIAQMDKIPLYTHPASEVIYLTKAEIESGLSRVKWAELLIKQLPEEHEGRNSWLLNYGEEK